SIELAAGKHDLTAQHHRNMRNTVGIGMKHGRQRHHHVMLGDGESIRQGERQRVKYQGPMRIRDSLGITRRAGGKAHGGCVGLLGLRVMKVAPSLPQKIFIILGSRRQNALLVLRHEHALDFGFAGELLPQRKQNVVDDEETILGVIYDKRQLVRMEPQVERVHDSSSSGNSKIGFDMSVVVPTECRDAVARLEAATLQGFSQRPCPAVEIAVGIAMNAAIGKTGNDLDFAIEPGNALQDGMQRERIIHHGAFHRGLLAERNTSTWLVARLAYTLGAMKSRYTCLLAPLVIL